MTVLKPGSSIKRQITIIGIDKPVQVEITSGGLHFWIKGSRKQVALSWPEAIGAGRTPESVPSFLMGKPLEFLRFQAVKR